MINYWLMIETTSGIEAFVHTAEQLSFRAAAARLDVSAAAVSKAVARLEEGLGVQLLERTSRKVSLTPEGARYLRHCRRALDALQAGRDAVLEASRVARGTVVVSVPPILGARVVEALPRLVARHCRLSCDMRVTDRLVRLHEEGVDVAVRMGALRDSSLVARKLRRPRRVTVASPSYLASRGTPASPEGLADHDCLKFSRPDGGVVEYVFAPRADEPGAPLELPTSHRIDQGELLVAAAAAGLGVVQAFDFLVERRIAAGQLVEILADRSAAGPPVHALCRARRQRTPKIRAVLDFFVDVLGPSPRP